jgi:hypothetical protein
VCRYAYSYKPHYACFRCRKVFRRRLPRDIGHHRDPVAAVCPQCRAPMADMGKDFQAPPRRDAKAWRTAEQLWEIGETFHSCGCQGPGYRPRDPRGFRRFLDTRRREYTELLEHWMLRLREGSDPEAERAVTHWRERLATIEAALRQLGLESS